MFAMWTPVMLIGALRGEWNGHFCADLSIIENTVFYSSDVAACNWTENDSTDSNAEVITGSVIGGIVMIAIGKY